MSMVRRSTTSCTPCLPRAPFPLLLLFFSDLLSIAMRRSFMRFMNSSMLQDIISSNSSRAPVSSCSGIISLLFLPVSASKSSSWCRFLQPLPSSLSLNIDIPTTASSSFFTWLAMKPLAGLLSRGRCSPEVASRSMRMLLLVGKNFFASSMPLRNAWLSMSMVTPFWPPKKAEVRAAWSPSPAGKVFVFVLVSSSAPSKNPGLWIAGPPLFWPAREARCCWPPPPPFRNALDSPAVAPALLKSAGACWSPAVAPSSPGKIKALTSSAVKSSSPTPMSGYGGERSSWESSIGSYGQAGSADAGASEEQDGERVEWPLPSVLVAAKSDEVDAVVVESERIWA
uniref:Uncharacterized protein n=1 Tax=Arundo donax TaxID=35708 RepID=A0A0A9BV49_ARUDO